jgi:hypothetical protein
MLATDGTTDTTGRDHKTGFVGRVLQLKNMPESASCVRFDCCDAQFAF